MSPVLLSLLRVVFALSLLGFILALLFSLRRELK
ncbi:hypothetical protein HNQ39_005586 [Armatimonas rosea]|uniref:Uncharacterized protein n=1 Tax=Armatimonas rosea TaxID=685828 RepID=A0A7W9SXM5_ARMRO|nr:hypothetical protein [Armatimonas rosea]